MSKPINPYLLELFRCLIKYSVKRNSDINLTALDRETIAEERQIGVSIGTLHRFFSTGDKATGSFSNFTLDSLATLIHKDFEYSNWINFHNKEKNLFSQQLPSKSFFSLSPSQQKAIIDKVKDRMDTLIAEFKQKSVTSSQSKEDKSVVAYKTLHAIVKLIDELCIKNNLLDKILNNF